MHALQVVLFLKPGYIDYHGKKSQIEANQLVMVGEEAEVHASNRSDWLSIFFYPGEISQVYPLLTELICPNQKVHPSQSYQVRPIPVFDELVNVIQQLHKVSKEVMLRFVCTYCLEMDKPYFSQLLNQYCDQNDRVFDFVNENAYEPWPVAKYAQLLDMDVTKLNTAFYRHYGQSTKSWLTEQRLSYAKQIILDTDRKISEVALDSGFSSHSHFIGAFRKRYQCSPSDLRSSRK